MKKKILIGMILLLLLPFCFVACNNKDEQGDNGTDMPVAVTSLKLDTDCLILKEGDIQKIDVSANSPDFDARLLEWKSTSECVVVAAGTVIARSPGYAEVTASYGDVSAVCEIGVMDAENAEFSLSASELVLEPGCRAALNVLRNGEKYPYAMWESSDTGVVAADENGVSAQGKGEAMVCANVHGMPLFCKVSVAGVDGNLSEWYAGNEPIYRGVILRDLEHPERGFEIYGRKTENGVFFGGSAWHASHAFGQNLWYQNTNFEVQLLHGSSMIQYFASEGFRSSGAVSCIATYINNPTPGAYNYYRSDFELFVPYDTDLDYIEGGIAFKSPGESMAMIRGGDDPILSFSDWWWADLHCPSNADELYYIYADGIYEQMKEEGVK